MATNRNLIIAAALGIVPAVLTLMMEHISDPSSNPIAFAIQGVVVVLLFPGMLASMAVSGNVHAYHLWVASIANFVIYFLVCWAVVALIGKVYRRLSASRHAKNL